MSTNRLCTICARGGSKGVPGKNLRSIAGLPLIAYSIKQALESKLFSHIAVSSDSGEILAAAKKAGANLLIERPATLATDTSPKLPVIQHCAKEAERISGLLFDTFVDLDATSPLRLPQDIENAVRLLESKKFSNIVTGAKARRSPYFNLVEMNADGTVHLSKPLPQNIVRRQDAPPCFDMNASIYAWSRAHLFESPKVLDENTGFYEMPEERSIDIDSELDFKIVSMLLSERYGNT